MPDYFLYPCTNCGLIDSSYYMVYSYKIADGRVCEENRHKICPVVDYAINRDRVYECYSHVLLYLINIRPKTKTQSDKFWSCINTINRYPHINEPVTIKAIEELNGMLRE